MYVANKTKGIGQVEKIENGKVTVYFEETDEAKIFIESMVTIFNTEEEAEEYLNPSMTEEEAEEIINEIENDKRIIEAGNKAQFSLEEKRIESFNEWKRIKSWK